MVLWVMVWLSHLIVVESVWPTQTLCDTTPSCPQFAKVVPPLVSKRTGFTGDGAVQRGGAHRRSALARGSSAPLMADCPGATGSRASVLSTCLSNGRGLE